MTDSPILPLIGLMGSGLSGAGTSPDGLRGIAEQLETLSTITGYASLATFAIGFREMAVEIANDELSDSVQIPITFTHTDKETDTENGS